MHVMRGHLSERLGSQIFQAAIGHGSKASRTGYRHVSMYAWKVHDSLNNPHKASISDKIKLEKTKLPVISTPSSVLIKVHATSINPLDYRMAYGYGRSFLDLMDWALNFEPRITNDRYPLTLGRDFSGEVVAKGPNANCNIGDLVFGAIEPFKSGAHSQYVIASSSCITKKPENISHEQAASIPFTALTAYSALCSFGNLSKDNCRGKQILVIGGTGGVGIFAIQLLKLWGADVYATCSEKKTKWLENTYFVNRAISYDDQTELSDLKGKFDFILDCGSYDRTSLTHQDLVTNSLALLKPHSQSVYVTLSSPFLSRIDQQGLVVGIAQSAMEAALDTYRGLQSFNSARWAFFMPNKSALDYIAGLYQDEAILPQVEASLSFIEMAKAFELLQSGQAKGKVVVSVADFDDSE